MLTDLVSAASLCSVTTTDEFSIPTNTPGWNRGSHFPPLAGLAGMHRIFSPNSRIGVLFLRPCRLCSGVFPSLPMSHLFIRYAANSTNQHNILTSGGTLVPCAMIQRSLQCPCLAGNEAHRTLDDTIGLAFSHWRSLWHNLTPFLAGLHEFSRQRFDRRLVVAPERNSVVPELIDELRCPLCDPGKLRSRMTSTAFTRSSDSFSPRNP